MVIAVSEWQKLQWDKVKQYVRSIKIRTFFYHVQPKKNPRICFSFNTKFIKTCPHRTSAIAIASAFCLFKNRDRSSITSKKKKISREVRRSARFFLLYSWKTSPVWSIFYLIISHRHISVATIPKRSSCLVSKLFKYHLSVLLQLLLANF